MALNWTMLNQNRAPIPLPNEITIMTVDDGAEIIIAIPNVPSSQGGSSGASVETKRLKETGRIYLTDQRLIFVAPAPNAILDSLSIPLASILATSFEQPLFGSNYLSFDIRPSPDGRLTNGTKAEIRLKDRGLFQFVSLLEKSRERAIYMKRQAQSDDDTLPLYDSRSAERTPEPSMTSTSQAGPSTPGDLPPGYDA
ncbi:hypothetical protein EW145_g3567 [Phellinidium pouzarii]|uniref:Uncharacterized protein n=1 Tax=Phellinidium pouzarii TaxID=167371 RepID=A0A4S4LBZ2_9AGAM|nr:hypothetical protein EW145_g3567 [Phellinidium pouzarii]